MANRGSRAGPPPLDKRPRSAHLAVSTSNRSEILAVDIDDPFRFPPRGNALKSAREMELSVVDVRGIHAAVGSEVRLIDRSRVVDELGRPLTADVHLFGELPGPLTVTGSDGDDVRDVLGGCFAWSGLVFRACDADIVSAASDLGPLDAETASTPEVDRADQIASCMRAGRW